MHTLDDYLNASLSAQDEERARRGWTPRPPTAHTHRGTPRAWEMDGYHEATKPRRTPTHRKNTPTRTPAHRGVPRDR